MLKTQLDADLKTAMLARDKVRAENLKMLKSAILYKEVELGVRETGLTDEQVVAVLVKEAKKRLDAAEMFTKAGNDDKAAAEKNEYDLISEYLPAQMSDEDLVAVVDGVLAAAGEVGPKDIGKIIGSIKAKIGSSADGATIAAIVKQKLS